MSTVLQDIQNTTTLAPPPQWRWGARLKAWAERTSQNECLSENQWSFAEFRRSLAVKAAAQVLDAAYTAAPGVHAITLLPTHWGLFFVCVQPMAPTQVAQHFTGPGLTVTVYASNSNLWGQPLSFSCEDIFHYEEWPLLAEEGLVASATLGCLHELPLRLWCSVSSAPESDPFPYQ
jgi:hypothetical protein